MIATSSPTRRANGPRSRSEVSRISVPSVVVGLAGEDLVGAVELLEQDDARELVGQGQRAEAEAVVDLLERRAHRTADDETDVARCLAALLDEGGEAQAVVGRARDVEQRDERVLG